MSATDTGPLFRRIGEILVSGSGTPPYTIAAGSFSNEWWYEGLEGTTGLAPHVLSKPQVKVELVELFDLQAWPKPSNSAMYQIELDVSLAYFTDSKILKNVREDLTTKIGNDVHRIVKALSHPGNLSRTNGGAPTGLAGGLLTQKDEPPDWRWDRETSVVTGDLVFTGFVVLSSSV